MKKVLRLFASLASYLDPSQIHTTKTGRASGRTARKSLIINDRLFAPPPKSSGNVRFCTFTFPEPIRSNPKLRAETCASGPAGAENPNGSTGLNGPVLHPQNRCTVLHCVAPCCAQKFSDVRCNTFTFPTEPGRCMVLPGCAHDSSRFLWSTSRNYPSNYTRERLA